VRSDDAFENFGWNPHVKDGLVICTLDPVNRPCSGDKVCAHALPLVISAARTQVSAPFSTPYVPPPPRLQAAVRAFQHEYWLADGLTVVNYGNVGALAGCNDCESDQFMRQGGYTYRWKNLVFENTNVRTKWVAPFKDIFQDLDGSLTGVGPNSTVLPYWAFNNWPECPRDAVGTFAYGTVCNSSVAVRRVVIDAVNPTQLYGLNMNITSSVGSARLQWRPKEEYGWAVPMVNQHNYRMGWQPSLMDIVAMDIRYSNAMYLPQEAVSVKCGRVRLASCESSGAHVLCSFLPACASRPRNL
jgi:hypothetical protein